MAMKCRGWVHVRLNRLVNRYGDVPILGSVLWWTFTQWQRLM